MEFRDIEALEKVLDAMERCEIVLGDLYKTCAQTWQEDADFWEGLSKAEYRHADFIRKIRKMVLEKTERFEAGRPFKVIAVETIIKGANDTNEKVRKGEIDKQKMLFLARDKEQSIIDLKYYEVVKSSDIEFQGLLKTIVEDTIAHNRDLNARIAALQRPT